MTNIFAITQMTNRQYPGYVSINEAENGAVEISVRSPAQDGNAGAQAMVPIRQADALRMRDALTKYIDSKESA